MSSLARGVQSLLPGPSCETAGGTRDAAKVTLVFVSPSQALSERQTLGDLFLLLEEPIWSNPVWLPDPMAMAEVAAQLHG